MYREKDQSGQMEFITFHMKFGGNLNPNNRWVRLAQLIPWEAYEAEYAAKFPAKVGNLAKPFRMALGALLIKEMKHLSDEELVEDIRENPYYQYLLGLESFQDTAPFEASSLVHFRKRISPEMLKEINEKIVRRQMERDAIGTADVAEHDDGDDDHGSTASGTSEPMEPSESSPSPSGDTNNGKLLVDATCVPADIRFPTDVGLLNEAREKLEEIIDVLHASLKEGKKPRTYREKARRDFLRVARNRKPRKKMIRQGIRKQLQYVRRDLAHIEAMGGRLGELGLPRRLHRNLLVVKEVYVSFTPRRTYQAHKK